MNPPAGPRGGFVPGGEAYRISGCELMDPFLMSVVSSSDHWMFVSSTGGWTAGRIDETLGLFPYETDDRLHVAYGVTGPLTILRAHHRDGEVSIWRPFDPARSDRGFLRHLTKSVFGDWVEFEEVDQSLGLTLTCRWATSERFGFVRSVRLGRQTGSTVGEVSVLDGFLNVMPPGVELVSQQATSTLVDAYKRSELDPATGVALFTLEAQISDRAEAAESLRTNLVWCRATADRRVLLTGDQIGSFLRGEAVRDEVISLGRRGAYLIVFDADLRHSGEATWELVADVGRSHAQVAELGSLLLAGSDPGPLIAADVAAGRAELVAIIAAADGLQHTADRTVSAHHAANVLFNVMRGGVFVDNHQVETGDFSEFVAARNRPVHAAHREFLSGLETPMEVQTLLQVVAGQGDADLHRLAYEFLPIFFSRRHGDPSRPWNRFSIRLNNPDGSRRHGYQGNWRDIFQNWEALALGFPRFLESMIAKFVNASTPDGHNPYRITDDGIDWEVPEPDNPWSNIGYWGDHQIVYLWRLLEAAERYHPGSISRLLDQPIFSYADVPYRIARYDALVKDPKNTIGYDRTTAAAIERRVAEIGSDGTLLADPTGSILHVTLAEKLLVPALAKLSNLVVDGGIWMNTQRPEWNDANNALVGHGLSMVTLGYLRRYLAWLMGLFEPDERAFPMSAEVAEWLQRVAAVLGRHQPVPERPVTDTDRRRLLDDLGAAYSDYRTRVYQNGFTGPTAVDRSEIVTLCRLALTLLDHSIGASRRSDRLFHSYNLLDLEPGTARVEHLSEMLEGQVAMLSAGILSPDEALELIDALFDSALYRADQHSFLLYPARSLPSFMDKNLIPPDRVATNPLLAAQVERGDDRILTRDALGAHRFHPDCWAEAQLEAALDGLAGEPEWAELVAAHRAATLDTFEAVFHHHAFTGRSGSMYKYEGLGSIYWHMVAKLLVAVQEVFFDAVDRHAPTETVNRLADAYRRIRGGLGFNKTPAEYGAFPTDPYSHTPAMAGAQQPGMTGQVKEEIITRTGELGIRVDDGTIRFQPVLLGPHELLTEPDTWQVVDPTGRQEKISLSTGTLGFTFCAVPIVYRIVETEPTLHVIDQDGHTTTIAGNRLDPDTSQRVFRRDRTIRRIEVDLPQAMLGWGEG